MCCRLRTSWLVTRAPSSFVTLAAQPQCHITPTTAGQHRRGPWWRMRCAHTQTSVKANLNRALLIWYTDSFSYSNNIEIIHMHLVVFFIPDIFSIFYVFSKYIVTDCIAPRVFNTCFESVAWSLLHRQKCRKSINNPQMSYVRQLRF